MGLEQFELAGKTAVVTGSSKGLGEAAAAALVIAGADLAICGRNRENIDRVADRMKALGRKAKGFKLEVTDRKTVEKGVC
jgi:NADP-dependent 3-hydroxy acid dehydrogenase YdfG